MWSQVIINKGTVRAGLLVTTRDPYEKCLWYGCMGVWEYGCMGVGTTKK